MIGDPGKRCVGILCVTLANRLATNAQPTGDADKDFVALMMPHHSGAIDMAKVELQYGKDATLRAMAQEIIASQQKEIDDMKKWQATHP